MNETSSRWIETGAVVQCTGGQLVHFLDGLFGFGSVVLCGFRLALPDGELVKRRAELPPPMFHRAAPAAANFFAPDRIPCAKRSASAPR
jgi:hypothetical protein